MQLRSGDTLSVEDPSYPGVNRAFILSQTFKDGDGDDIIVSAGKVKENVAVGASPRLDNV